MSSASTRPAAASKPASSVAGAGRAARTAATTVSRAWVNVKGGTTSIMNAFAPGQRVGAAGGGHGAPAAQRSRMAFMELKIVPLEIPEGGNLILGQTHFIKTVEDVYEAIVNTVPQIKFGVAFNEASGPCLTRVDGNDDALKALAARNATAVA